MKKIVSYVLVVGSQITIGALFLFMLFSNKIDNNDLVVVENNNLNKMADSVSELFEAAEKNAFSENSNVEEEIISKEEAEKKRLEQEEAERIAREEAERVAREQEEAQRRAEEERRAAEEAQRRVYTSSSLSDLQAYARELVLNNYGWTEDDFYALVNLWNRESGWRVDAANPSGAYGIPQALPASKMASEGGDYLTNGETQIRWGLNYIRERYGSPLNAWAFFQSHNWY